MYSCPLNKYVVEKKIFALATDTSVYRINKSYRTRLLITVLKSFLAFLKSFGTYRGEGEEGGGERVQF